ncbi:hypothetical protein TIFTF001_029638 [Ficus carica]|uniref:Uncharacterized protein n=1 Tax=Ficus carica TaxID=3494 RepID=A0AA88DS63_FICCA|nr:hypothetical protein TIFTF001_029638 [Ficus carica]
MLAGFPDRPDRSLSGRSGNPGPDPLAGRARAGRLTGAGRAHNGRWAGEGRAKGALAGHAGAAGFPNRPDRGTSGRSENPGPDQRAKNGRWIFGPA